MGRVVEPGGGRIFLPPNSPATIQDIINKLSEECEDVPDDAEKHVKDFIKELVEKGYVGFEV